MFVLIYLENGVPKIHEEEFISVEEAETYIKEKGIQEFKIFPNSIGKIDLSQVDKGYC